MSETPPPRSAIGASPARMEPKMAVALLGFQGLGFPSR